MDCLEETFYWSKGEILKRVRFVKYIPSEGIQAWIQP